jgi:predicted DNA-binding protein
MRLLTEQLSVTMSCDKKAKLKASAAERGVSMGTVVREIIEDLVALGKFEIWMAERELNAGATVQ